MTRPGSAERSTTVSIPENHYDIVVTPNSIRDSAKPMPLVARIITVAALPLFFVVAFVLCYVSALHAPAPHNFPLAISGSTAQTAELETALTERAGKDAFALTRMSSPGEARAAVTGREALGAIIVEHDRVNTIIASSGGVSAASLVKGVGVQVAVSLDLPNTVTDVAVPRPGDPTGTGLFFLFVVCTVGAYLSITALSQVHPRARTRTQLLLAAGAAVLAPLIGIGIESIFIDSTTTELSTLGALYAVAVLYTFTVGILSSLFVKLLGQAGAFAGVLVLLAINLPSSGGASPAAMLPGFWQGVHDVWIGAGGLEAMRSILAFDGAQVGRWIVQLTIWTIVSLVLLIVVSAAKRRRPERARRAAAAVSGELPESGVSAGATLTRDAQAS